jgi:hypothetical protein
MASPLFNPFCIFLLKERVQKALIFAENKKIHRRQKW